MRMHRIVPVCAAVLIGLLAVGCGDDSDEADEDSTTTTVEAADEEATVDEYCEKNEELIEVRGAVYGQPFDETPEEVEALLAESDTLSAELEPLVPEEIQEPLEFLQAEFVEPIDALTEANGWDPFTAINTPEAAAIFEDPEIGEAQTEVGTFNEEACGIPFQGG